mgnify:CR=1 FL=1
MFGFLRNRTIGETGILHGMTDWHCHILPGVDDGFRSLEDSLEALSRYESLGVSEVWLTPHVMEDVPSTTEALKNRFSELCDAYKGPLRLYLAAEYMMDSLFERRLRDRDLLPLGTGGKHLLVETSYFNPPAGLVEILKSIKAAGYFPVLAHPERYMYMDMEDYSALMDSGVRLQLNLCSLVGMYGKEVQKKAFRLLRKGCFSIVGTDLHRLSQLDFLTKTRRLPGNIFKNLSKTDFLTTI